MSDKSCQVHVYSAEDTKALIDDAKTKVIDETHMEIAKEINSLPSSPAILALRAQLKEEVKTEVLSELQEEIMSGKLKLATDPSTPTTH